MSHGDEVGRARLREHRECRQHAEDDGESQCLAHGVLPSALDCAPRSTKSLTIRTSDSMSECINAVIPSPSAVLTSIHVVQNGLTHIFLKLPAGREREDATEGIRPRE